MGLRIRTNVSSLQAQRQLYLSSVAKAENMEKLSSGFRINKAADDAAGLAISEGLKAQIRSLDQAKRNATDGISMVQIAEGSMNEMTNILIRLRELAVQASSDTIGNVERSYSNLEYVQLVDEIDRMANTTEFNGTKVLKGPEANNDISNFTIHVGSGDGRVENVDTINFDIKNLRILTNEDLGLGKGAEIGPKEVGDEFSREVASAKLIVLDTALTQIARKRAELGAKQNRLNSAVNNLGIQLENKQAANSRIRDADFAAETAQFTQNQILSTSGVAVLTQANQSPEVVLSLLK